MADSIQFRRGLRSAVKPLPIAMPGYIEDEKRLIVGNGDGTNTEVSIKSDVSAASVFPWTVPIKFDGITVGNMILTLNPVILGNITL